MIFKAVVLDNSMFFTRGTIRVRIAGFYNKKIVWNLEEKFPDVLTEGDIEGVNTQFSNDYEAQISSAFGGGRNYGSVVIPQINEKGIVAFLNGDKKNPVWLGGLFETFRDDSFNVEYVNFPTDKFVDGEDIDGVLNGEGNIGDDVEPQEEKSIIIRTKHTTSNSVEEIDFQQQDTSNIITVGKKRIRVTHFPEGSWEEGEPQKYDDFLIGSDEDGEEVIRLDKKDYEKETFATFEIKENIAKLFIKQKDGDNVKIERSFTIGIDDNGDDVIRLLNKNEEENDFVEFELKKEQGVLSLTKGGEEIARLSINEEDITLFNKEGSNKLSFIDDDITISNKEGENKLTFSESGDITISNKEGSNKIVFGNNDEIELENDSGSKIIMKANGNIELLANNEVHILGDDDHLVRYSELKEIIEEIEDHIHIAPSGPTSGALNKSQAPLVSVTMKPSISMKSQKGKLD